MSFNGASRFGIRLALLAASFVVASCTTTGRTFDSLALAKFVPGETTFQEAVKLFGAEPDNTYAQLNGSMTARWSYKGSVLTDAIYFRQEVMLRFDPAGRFERVVDTVNVISRPGVPNPPAAQRVINEPTEPVAVREVERIIIVPASSGQVPVKPASSKASVMPANSKETPSGNQKSNMTPVSSSANQPATTAPVAPSVNQPATTLPVPAATAGSEIKPVPVTSTGAPAPSVVNTPPAAQNPASSELEQPLTNPSVTYPVPSARKP